MPKVTSRVEWLDAVDHIRGVTQAKSHHNDEAFEIELRASSSLGVTAFLTYSTSLFNQMPEKHSKTIHPPLPLKPPERRSSSKAQE